MTFKNAWIAVAAIAISTSVAIAQGPPGGPEGGRGAHPILAALDADNNRQLSAEEIKNATKALQALDKNGDGIINEEDIGRMGPPAGGPGGPGGPGGNADTGERVNDFASRLLAFDKNENGKVEKDELPERMQRVLGNLDTNKDGVLDEAELREIREAAKKTQASSGRNRRGGRNAGRGQGGPGGARRGSGGPGGMRGGPPGGGGGPERMIEHAFEFDKDGDGKLSREELTEFARNMPGPGGPGMGGPRMRGQGGPGGPPGGRRGAGRGDR